MKAGVTGHSGGLGQAIANRLARDGYEIVGFSLDNGYDIATDDGVLQIVSEAVGCDLFVNCAHDRQHHGVGQVTLLLRLFHEWQDQEKHIISIGSNAPDYVSRTSTPIASKYRAAKTALDAANLEISTMGKPCRASIVRPNWLNSVAATEREQRIGVTLPKLECEEVADVVAMIASQGPSVTISSITLTRTVRRVVPAPASEVEAKPKKWWKGRS